MAWGFTPKYIDEYSLTGFTQQQSIALALKAVEKSGLKISYQSNAVIVAYTNNGALSRNAELTIDIAHTVATIKSASVGNEMFDLGHNKKNVQNFISTLDELSGSYTKEELDALYNEISADLSQAESDEQIRAADTLAGQLKGFLSFFIPRKNYFVSPILIDINIVIFIIMALSGVNVLTPDNESLLLWGANFGPMTLNGEWWRLITACFLHIGVIHLLMNVYALVYIGLLLEPYLGKWRFIIAYVLTGVAASTISLAWHDMVISAGASGAIFGMYGVFLALLTTNIIEKDARKAMLMSIAIFVGYNLLNGMKEGIDNAAHTGGLISGMIVGYAFVPGIKKPHNRPMHFGLIGLVGVVVIGFCIYMYKNTTNDILKYDAKMQEFIANEELALSVFAKLDNADSQVLVRQIQDGIKKWEANKEIIEEVDNYKLSADFYIRNAALREYCNLRINSYRLFHKAIVENTEAYQSEIQSYTLQIDSLINSITVKQ